MSPIDFFWHAANLLATSVLMGLSTASLGKLFWGRALAALPWWRLAVRTALAAAAVTVTGLVALGRDGLMVSYAAMVLAAAGVLGWSGRGRFRA